MLVMVAMMDCAVIDEHGRSCSHHRRATREEDVVKYDVVLVREIKEQEKETTDFSENTQKDCEFASDS